VSYSVNLKESKYLFKEIKYCPNIPYFKLTDIKGKLSELVIDFEMLQKQFFLYTVQAWSFLNVEI